MIARGINMMTIITVCLSSAALGGLLAVTGNRLSASDVLFGMALTMGAAVSGLALLYKLTGGA